MLLHRSPAAVVLAVLCAATPAFAQMNPNDPNNPNNMGTKKTDEPFPLHYLVSLSHFLGQGTFVAGYANNPNVSSSLTITPMLSVGKLTLIAQQSMDVEWTQSDLTTHQNQVILRDTALAVLWRAFALPEYGLALNITGVGTLPLSLQSRNIGRMSTLTATARLNYMYAPWSLGGFVGGNINHSVVVPAFANRGPTSGDARPYEDRFLGTMTPNGCLLRSPDEAANYACTGSLWLPPLGGYTVNAGAFWATLQGQLIFSTTVGLMQQFSRIEGKDDQYTSPYAQTGLQQRDPFTTASASISYIPISWFTLAVGTSTWQPLYATDMKSVRVFPWWDFTGQAWSWSSVFVDTTFFY
jgi:hypothetical protein